MSAPRPRASLATEDDAHQIDALRLDIHDTVLQELVALRLFTRAGYERCQRAGSEFARDFLEFDARLARVLVACRSLVAVEASPALGRRSLRRAIEEVIAVFQIDGATPITFEAIGPFPAVRDLGARRQLLSVLREALSNAIQHSQANRIDVRLEAAADGVLLSVIDDGVGIPILGQRAGVRMPGRGLGLHSMDLRIRALAGQLTVSNRSPHGTKVECWIPNDPR